VILSLSFSGSCLQKSCPRSSKIEYATYSAWFGHYYRKGREVLIELVIELGLSEHPYGEPTYLLADKLVKATKVNSEGVAN